MIIQIALYRQIEGSPILNQRAAQLLLGSIREIILHTIKECLLALVNMWTVDCVNDNS